MEGYPVHRRIPFVSHNAAVVSLEELLDGVHISLQGEPGFEVHH
jgi:hypothetical protein